MRTQQASPFRRGFSLPETMLAMLLVFTILGMVALLMREYSEVARFVDAKSRTFDGVQFALAEMSHEVASAVRMNAPRQGDPEGTTSATLEFRRIDPAIERYSLKPDDAGDEGEPVIWNFRKDDEMMRVLYQRNLDGTVTRTVTRSGNVSTQKMCDSVTGMMVLKRAQDYLEIQLSFEEEKRVRTFVSQTRVWPHQR